MILYPDPKKQKEEKLYLQVSFWIQVGDGGVGQEVIESDPWSDCIILTLFSLSFVRE